MSEGEKKHVVSVSRTRPLTKPLTKPRSANRFTGHVPLGICRMVHLAALNLEGDEVCASMCLCLVLCVCVGVLYLFLCVYVCGQLPLTQIRLNLSLNLCIYTGMMYTSML